MEDKWRKIYKVVGETELEDTYVSIEDLENIINDAKKNGSNYVDIQPLSSSYCSIDGVRFTFYFERYETEEEFNDRIKKENDRKAEMQKIMESEEYKTYLKLREKFINLF